MVGSWLVCGNMCHPSFCQIPYSCHVDTDDEYDHDYSYSFTGLLRKKRPISYLGRRHIFYSLDICSDMSASTLNRFDKIARVYDTLAYLVFGNAIAEAQLVYIKTIPHQANVLIVGGGTGKFLQAFLKERPFCKVWYVEASATMIALAKQKTECDQVHFIHGTETDVPSAVLFDAIITHFYLDLFRKERLNEVIHSLMQSGSPEMKWIVTDFIKTNKLKHAVLLTAMYAFFRIFSSIESLTLPDWHKAFKVNGLQEVCSTTCFNGFIKSAVYEKAKGIG